MSDCSVFTKQLIAAISSGIAPSVTVWAHKHGLAAVCGWWLQVVAGGCALTVLVKMVYAFTTCISQRTTEAGHHSQDQMLQCLLGKGTKWSC